MEIALVYLFTHLPWQIWLLVGINLLLWGERIHTRRRHLALEARTPDHAYIARLERWHERWESGEDPDQ